MNEIDHYFAKNYVESRETFRGHLDHIQKKWPQATLTTKNIGKENDNTIDMIYSEALSSNDRVLFFTTGEHGIEGYAGAAVVHYFVENYLNQIDASTTGICLIHALNPWGMRHFRRVTENNIDLNRNYFYDENSVRKDVNKNYAKESDLFLPNGKITNLKEERHKIYAQLIKGLAKEGYAGLKKAKGMGQFQFERGVYYGGDTAEESAVFLKEVQRNLLGTFPSVIHMDWHTALGPTNEVTMVISEHDGRSVDDLKKGYHLKNVEKYTPEKVKGDSTNHFYKLKEEMYPETYLLSALFEFGTFGTDKQAELREFMTIILENHLYHEGAESVDDIQWILGEFEAMFYPNDPKWKKSVLEEARTAIEGVLKHERILK
ncbi:M14 family metallopeptidase [Bacillus sp. RAR_GA_16]|uniref:M14 family metallopeptidase n=1 Tax=Bacillus sp. RAR_GA_16 TaxID=2876774 RepID=UPI001CCA0E2E|nr:M14 family metallopeptidase [Bacillus sp. RAR_GA_16]MCA0173160.1 M14 family metallopeptidase [Bacillus sp. RAR_GA_16]